MNDAVVLQLGDAPEYLQETIASILSFIPRLVAAVIILLIGWIIGRLVAGVVRKLADAAEVDRMVMGTPIGSMLGGTEAAVSGALGKIAAYYVYFLALLAASDALAIPVLSQWVGTAVSYLPAFIAGVLIVVGGFILADFLGDTIERTQSATGDRAASLFADGARFFLYFIALVVGLDTMGVDVQMLYIFGRALAYGFAAAVAIGGGLAIGLGGSDYVSENIDGWTSRASDAASSGGGGGSGAQPAGDDD